MIQSDFLPKSLSAWLGVLVTISGILSASWALALRTIRKPLMDEMQAKFQAQGQRIGAMESASERLSGKVEGNDRQLERLHLQVTSMSEQYGRFEAKFDALRITLEERKDERHRENREIAERLTAIETKMEIFDQIGAILRTISEKRV